MKKLLLIDGHSILNRAFFGLPDLTNGAGLHTNAVYGFLNILFKLLDTEEPDALIVAFDVHAPTFRHKMYASYKGTRKPMAEELRQQLSETALVRLTNLSYRMDEARGEFAERMDDARGRLDDMREQAGDAYDQLAETAKVRLTNLSYRMDDARGEWSEKMDGAKEQFSGAKDQILARLDDIQRRFSARADGLKRTRKSMLRGNPTARSARYDDVPQRLKKELDTHKRG